MLASATSLPLHQGAALHSSSQTSMMLSRIAGTLMTSTFDRSGRCLHLPPLRHTGIQPTQQMHQHHQHTWPAAHAKAVFTDPAAAAAAAAAAVFTPPQVVQPFRRMPVQRAYSAAAAAAAGSEEPIIVAASWLGAKKRPFSKYKDLWRSLGFSRILAARPPMASIMVPAAGQLLAADFTRKLIQTATQHPAAPILVHLFSGGGFIFMGWVFQLLGELNSPEAEAVRSRIRGVILDSSPANVTADVSSRALIAAVLGQPADGIEEQYPWLVKPTAAFVEGYFKLSFIRDALVSMEQAWLQQAPACPKLFLYSDADVLIEPGTVEEFMQQQQARGSPTFSYKWHDSAHVDHYRKYPEEYRQQLQQFVEQVLEPGSCIAGSSVSSCASDMGSMSSSSTDSSSESSTSSTGSSKRRVLPGTAGDELV